MQSLCLHVHSFCASSCHTQSRGALGPAVACGGLNTPGPRPWSIGLVHGVPHNVRVQGLKSAIQAGCRTCMILDHAGQHIFRCDTSPRRAGSGGNRPIVSAAADCLCARKSTCGLPDVQCICPIEALYIRWLSRISLSLLTIARSEQHLACSKRHSRIYTDGGLPA
jgi:hypothetical protein